MAGVKKVGKRYHVINTGNKATIKRKGRKVTYATRAAAVKDAKATERRVRRR